MMAGYTPFGEQFRVLRIKNREVLGDASKFLGVTSAYISSVECGKRPVPQEWIGKISKHYQLTEQEERELEEAAEQSKRAIKIDMTDFSPLHRSVALQFQRSFGAMDEKTAKAILEIMEGKK